VVYDYLRRDACHVDRLVIGNSMSTKLEKSRRNIWLSPTHHLVSPPIHRGACAIAEPPKWRNFRCTLEDVGNERCRDLR
jgi:hypothetical protein